MLQRIPIDRQRIVHRRRKRMFGRHAIHDGDDRNPGQPRDRNRFSLRPRIDHEAAAMKVDQQPPVGSGVASAAPHKLDRDPGDLALLDLDVEPLRAALVQRLQVIGGRRTHRLARDRVAHQRRGHFGRRACLYERLHGRAGFRADGRRERRLNGRGRHPVSSRTGSRSAPRTSAVRYRSVRPCPTTAHIGRARRPASPRW